MMTKEAAMRYGRMSGPELRSLDWEIKAEFNAKLNTIKKDIKNKLSKDGTIPFESIRQEYRFQVKEASSKIWNELASMYGLIYKKRKIL